MLEYQCSGLWTAFDPQNEALDRKLAVHAVSVVFFFLCGGVFRKVGVFHRAIGKHQFLHGGWRQYIVVVRCRCKGWCDQQLRDEQSRKMGREYWCMGILF